MIRPLHSYYEATKSVDRSGNKYKTFIEDKYKTPQMRANLVNYVLDGTLPENSSEEQINQIKYFGNAIMNAEGIEIRTK